MHQSIRERAQIVDFVLTEAIHQEFKNKKSEIAIFSADKLKCQKCCILRKRGSERRNIAYFVASKPARIMKRQRATKLNKKSHIIKPELG